MEAMPQLIVTWGATEDWECGMLCFVNLLANVLGNLQGAPDIRFRHNDGEFLSSIPRNQIAGRPTLFRIASATDFRQASPA